MLGNAMFVLNKSLNISSIADKAVSFVSGQLKMASKPLYSVQQLRWMHLDHQVLMLQMVYSMHRFRN